MRKKERAAIVIERLKKEYPEADCTLDYNEAWKLLVSVRLAAQCTDERVNIIVKDLFAKYPGVNELAEAEPEDIEAIVRPCGLGKSKAKDISKCMRMLRDEFDSKVPDNFDDLMKLPYSCVDKLQKAINALAKKYEDTYANIENEIREAEAELCEMMSELTGSEADMAAIHEFQKLLGGKS